jgi:hypothetical protein
MPGRKKTYHDQDESKQDDSVAIQPKRIPTPINPTIEINRLRIPMDHDTAHCDVPQKHSNELYPRQ